MAGDAALLTSYSEIAGPRDTERVLERAVSLNPFAWQAWIRLGFIAESGSRFERAEYCFRQAAQTNRQYQPAWTLANYFLRRENRREFEVWAGRALRMAFGDQRPLFELCWKMDPDPMVVLRSIPGRRDVLRQYLAYLVAEGRLAAAATAARQLVPGATAADIPNLVSYCSRVLETGSADGALEIWNDLCRQRAIPYRALIPESGLSLTNGDFNVAPFALAFDWRIIPWTGIFVANVAKASGLRIAFSGEQPDSCEVLTQLLPVQPGRTYRLAYEYRTPGAAPETGIRWQVFDANTGAELAQVRPQLSSPTWEQQMLPFTTGSACRLARLALIYQRVPGTRRIEGQLWLRQISLQ